ncbi:MAG: hypothetical protein HZA77_15375 [Candidatus Schekmanbacteria bacterium]|nr:hypothetical protein [Candidatus Schekmanbacteria bacterium]
MKKRVLLFIFFFMFTESLSWLLLEKAHAEINIAGIKLSPAVSVNYGYDDNYTFSEKKSGAYTVSVLPSLNVKYIEGITDFEFNANSPYRYFSESTDKKSKFYETFYDSHLNFKLPMDVKIEFDDNFVSTKLSPFLTEERFNRTDRSENHFHGNFTLPLGTLLGFNIDYRNDNYRYVDSGDAFFPFSLNNRKYDNVSFRTYYKVLSDTRVFYRYSYQRLIYKNDKIKNFSQTNNNSQAHQSDYGIDQSIGNIFRISGSIGTGQSKHASADGRGRNKSQDDRFVWNTTLFVNAGEKLDIFFNVGRSVTNTDNFTSKNRSNENLSIYLSLNSQLTTNTKLSIIGGRSESVSSLEADTDTVFKNFTIELEQKFFERINSDLEFQYGINEYSGGFTSIKNDKRWSIDERIDFNFNKHLTLGVDYLHQNRSLNRKSSNENSNSSFGNYNRNVVTFNVRLSY